MRRARALLAGLAMTALAAGTVIATGHGIEAPADVPTARAARLTPPRPALVIGDSAIAALRWVPGADNALLGFTHTLDLESCRRLYLPSCRGREGRTPPTAHEALADHGAKYKVLVVATGYNDGTSVFAESFRRIVARARSLGYIRIVWWTLRSDVDYVSPGSVGNHLAFAQNNRILRDLLATGDYPDVVLADWGAYTADRPEWFVTDGVHYRQIGAWGASDYLSRKMAFLEGRACPMPRHPSQPVENPCPDPDVTGPVADIEALYTIGAEGVLCYEIGEQRRVECRFDTHVIQLTRELSLGMRGTDVSALQVRLERVGFSAGGTDGSFGTATYDAVAAYQGANGLPATGAADRATLASLGFDVSAIP